MKLDLDKILAATLPEALDMGLDPELSDPAFWLAAGVIGVGLHRLADDITRELDALVAKLEIVQNTEAAVHTKAYQWDRSGAELALRKVRDLLLKQNVQPSKEESHGPDKV